MGKNVKDLAYTQKITVEVVDYQSLKELIYRLNNESTYGVSLLKWKI